MKALLRHWPWAALLASAVMLAMAHAFESLGHLLPCMLCLREREVYWASLAVAGLGVVGSFTPFRALAIRLVSLALALLFLAGAALAVYHAGAEWGWWPGPAACSGGAVHLQTADLNALLTTRSMAPPACNKAAWVFLGLSMAGWNAVISLGLAALSGLAVAQRRS